MALTTSVLKGRQRPGSSIILAVYGCCPGRFTSIAAFMHTGAAADSCDGQTTSREPCDFTVTAQVPTDLVVSQRPVDVLADGVVAQPASSTPERSRASEVADARKPDFIAVLTCGKVPRIFVRAAPGNQNAGHTSWASNFNGTSE